MNTKFKLSDKALTNALYIGAAILILTVICVSLFAVVSQSRKKKTEVPLTTTGDKVVTTTGTPVTEAPVTTSSQNTPKTPTTKENINTSKEEPVSVSYTNPVEAGTLAKLHTEDTLVFSVTMNDYRIHNGIDIAASVGSPVYAVADGEVSAVSKDSLMGVCISVEHADGMISCYKNLSETLPTGITVGTKVTKGQLIGSIGETAIVEQSDEAHLHLEMIKDGKQINPLDYLSYKQEEAPADDTDKTE